MPRTSQIVTLQVGRAIAAIAVVIYHAAQMTVGLAGPFPGSFILLHGDLGVDFFFVLSGFIIYHSSARTSLGSFARARVRRVYLPYLPVGIAMGLFLWAIGSDMGGWSWLPTLSLAPFGRPALSVAWTLQHEIVFYAVFALFYYAGHLAAGLMLWAILIMVAAMIGVTFLPLALINLEFLAGVAAAFAFHRGWGDRRWYGLACLPLLLWIALGARTNMSILVGFAIAFSIVPVARWEQSKTTVMPRYALFLGAASYAIYLVHVVAISTVSRLVSGWPLMMTVSISAGIVAGLLYHIVIERPLLRLKIRATGRLLLMKLSPPKRTV